jgi:hypothetical protein
MEEIIKCLICGSTFTKLDTNMEDMEVDEKINMLMVFIGSHYFENHYEAFDEPLTQ